MPDYVCALLRASLRHSFVLAILFLLSGSLASTEAQIKFMQGNSATPQNLQATVTVPYTLAQAAGDLNVVVVGWNDSTASVSSVTDTRGNGYALAAATIIQSGVATQAIYYAKNIVAAPAVANAVTVTFTVAPRYPDIRIAEYSGLDPINPLDVSVGAQGNSTTSSSGVLTTTNATDLLVGANLVQTTTVGAGAGFTSRMITNPDGDILEDQVALVTGSYMATAPISGGAWIMQIVAFRAASGTRSSVPTAPGNLTAAASGPVQINLSWTASTEIGGAISQYLIERCAGANCTTFSQIATVAASATSFSNNGLIGSTSYSYRVRAIDTSNVTGSYSSTASAATPVPTFVAPSALTSTVASPTQINLSWTAATETGGTMTQYLIERCTGASCTTFSQLVTIAASAASFSDTSVAASTKYSYRVRVTDGVNFSAYSNVASATTPANSPTGPTNLSATASGPVQINLSWTASTETGGTISQYLIERCRGTSCTAFSQLTTVAAPATTFSDTGLNGSTSYSYRVRAMDASSVTGPYSNTASATTATPTFTAPSALTSTAASPAQVNLSWTAATETGGTITQYLIERCSGASCATFTQIATIAAAVTSFNDTGLTGSTSYNYRVRATDGVNFSGYSNTGSATTPAPTFTAPSGLTVTTASTTQINLSWTAATETGGTITQYLIERCTGPSCSNFAQVGTSVTTSFNNTTLAAGMTYSYRVRATDAASDFSPYSNVATATTTPTPPQISYIQGNSATPQTSQTTVTVAYTLAQTAGNLNVVVVGWNDSTATVSSVTDTKGNSYLVAAAPVVQTGMATQAIYYAKNILAAATGANTVTVTFSTAAVFADIRIAEYSGLDPTNPLDVSVGAQGNSSTSSSGAVSTTNANDLLVGANLVQTITTGAGAGFATRIITSPDGDILEDQVVIVTGSYDATASISGGAWIMQMAAFRAAGSGGTLPDTTPPTVSITSPTSGATVSGTITITATASDPDSPVSYVQIQLDGSNVGPRLTTAPYSFVLDTTKLANGSHKLTAFAVDPAGDTGTSAAIAVTVSNSSPDTTPPTVSITYPSSGATVSGTITITASASDPDSPVAFVQLLLDGANLGSHLTSSPYSFSWNTATAANGTHTLTAIAQDPAGNQGTSAAVTLTVSNAVSTGATGPLRPLASNPNYFTDGSGKAILLTGSHTWNDFQDMGNTTPQSIDFNAFVSFLVSHHMNATILWRKDLPEFCGWGAGGTWNIDSATGFPWARPGPGTATDGNPKFDLNTFNQAYFDRLRSRVMQLQQNGIYAIVQLFDGFSLVQYRCSTDGYPFTGSNNINGIDDGGGTGSMTMTSPDPITAYQEAFVKKVVDTLNDQPNVIWETSEEAPDNSTWWQSFIIDLLHTYEGGGTLSETGEVFTAKASKHPVDFPSLNVSGASDSTLYNSNADMVSPQVRISPTTSCGTGTPACKVNVNDSDHTYFGMWNDTAQTNRNYVWENFTGGNSVVFMDPYLIYWSSGNRNLCQNQVNGVCSGVDTRWDNLRNNMGYTLSYANKMDLAKMTAHASLSSTGYCLAQTPATGAEYLVYAPNGGSFTVDLRAMSSSRTLKVEWFNPSVGATTAGGTVSAGSVQSFTPPFSGDAVLYLVDSTGLTSSSSSLSFGNINVGSSSTQSVILTNSGSSNVSVSNVTISGAGFSVNGISTGLILSPGASVTMNVIFAPAASGGVTGSVTISNSASNSPLTILISGTGVVPTHLVTLTWTAGTSVVVGYNVYRGTASGGPYTRINSSIDTTTTFKDTAVQAGQTYYWVVTAENSSNVESAYSNEVVATIPTP